MNLDTLLQDNPAYSDALAEQVLQHYLRFKHASILRLQKMGMDSDDVEQELRIALWKAWQSYKGHISLRKWLSWKLDYRLRDLQRHYARHLQGLQVVSWEDLIASD